MEDSDEDWDFDDCVAYLGERGRKDRERAYTTLTQMMSDHLELDQLRRHADSLESHVAQGVRSSSQSECSAACTCLTLMLLSGMPSADTVFVAAVSPLRALLADLKKQDASELIISVARLLSWGTFLAVTNEEEIDGVVQALSECMERTRLPKVIDCWTFLVSSLSADTIVETVMYSVMECFEELLVQGDVELKASVALALQVLFHGARLSEPNNEYDPNGFIDMNEIEGELSELVTTTFKGPKPRAKRLKKLFQETEQVVMHGKVYDESLTFNQQRFTFQGAATLFQLNYLREVVGSGFSEHMCDNKLLQNVFNIEVAAKVEKKRITKQQKRMEKGKNTAASKTTSKDRKRDYNRKTLNKSFNDEDY